MRLAALALALLAAPPQDGACLFEVELELVGPLEGARVLGSRGETHVEGRLAAGERRTLAVPVLHCVPLWRETLGESAPPAVAAEGAGSARLVRWAAAQPPAALEDLPWGLARRPLPRLPRPFAAAARVPASVWLALAASALLTLAARRRPLVQGLVALLGGLAVGWTAGARGERAGAPVTVLEADLAAEAFVEVCAAQDALPLGFDGLEVEPAGAPLAIAIGLDGAGQALAPGALLVGRARVAARGTLRAGRNGLEDLARAWVRVGGAWSYHGAWPAGAALPSPREGPSPPGWLVAGLPPGTGIVVGERAEGRGWLRASGFDEGGGGR